MEENLPEHKDWKLKTEKLYLIDSYQYELKSSMLIGIEEYPKDSNSLAMIFNKTIFHPQGGGQPSDEGEIFKIFNTEKIVKFSISCVSYDRDRELILHKVSKDEFANFNEIEVGNEFGMRINEEKRRFYARLHSAGHLLDIAVSKLGLNLIPGKGYHFPDGPYVEYSGSIEKSKIPFFVKEIEKVSNEVISESNIDDNSISKFYDYEEGTKEFVLLPNYLPENKPFRWVKLLKMDLGCPCGGTHVKHVKDINQIKITKITNKGKLIRISYNVTN